MFVLVVDVKLLELALFVVVFNEVLLVAEDRFDKQLIPLVNSMKIINLNNNNNNKNNIIYLLSNNSLLNWMFVSYWNCCCIGNQL